MYGNLQSTKLHGFALLYVYSCLCEIVVHNIHITLCLSLVIVAIASLSQSQYSVLERDNSVTGNITLSSRTSEDVIVEVTISNGSANGNIE